jgi:hypothetical protein
LSLLCLAAALVGQARAANLDGSTQAVGDAEAARLYTEANAYVQNLAAGDYS